MRHYIAKKLTPTDDDNRKWQIVSDYFGNDPQPCTTREIYDYADGDESFDLHDFGDEIVDINRQRGDEGFVVAELIE